jgi:hypothetical protein
MERCTCPGAAWAKDIHQEVVEESSNRQALAKEAIDEVVDSRPSNRQSIVRALEEAYSRRGIELSNVERTSVPDVVQARLAPRPVNQFLAFKALGNLGVSLIREVRNALKNDGDSQAAQDE